MTDMHGRFTVLEVRDPHLIIPSVWESLPPSGKNLLTEREYSVQEWEPFDRRRFRIEPESYRTEVSVANVGALRATWIAHDLATETTLRSPGMDGFGILITERGSARVVFPRSEESAIGKATTGLIYNTEPRVRAIGSDLHTRLFLRLPAMLLRRTIEVLLDGQNVASVAFRPMFDQRRGAGATIRRMTHSLFAELAESDSLLTNELAIRSFEEHLALCLLLGLPHSHSERLLRQRAAAAPTNVKRAEEFMRTNAREPLTIEAIATAAGCSVRALQLAFRRFRSTTPMAALQRIRLEAAREEMLRAERAQSLARIAAEHGFSNPSRFAQLFRRTYGAYPSEALKTRHRPHIGAPDISAQVALAG